MIEEWWQHRSSLAAADVITLAAGQTARGAHGSVHPQGVTPPVATDPVDPGTPVDPGDPVDPGGVSLTIRRVAGANRYETAVAISKAVYQQPGVDLAFIANGLNFPDALAGASIVGASPILLTKPTELPGVVAAEPQRLKPKQIIVFGGPTAVSNAVLNKLKTYAPSGAVRVWGETRYDTAVAISKVAISKSGNPGTSQIVYLANGMNFPDALAGAPVAALDGAPVLLTSATSLPGAIKTELQRLKPKLVIALGGPVAVSVAVLAQVEAALT